MKLPSDNAANKENKHMGNALTEHQMPGVTRRKFLKTTAVFTLGSAVISQSLASALIAKGDIAIIVVPDDSIASATPPTWAIGELKSALEAQKAKVKLINRIEDAEKDDFCILIAGMNSSLSKSILDQQKLAAPTEAESLCLVQGKTGTRPVLLVAGTNELGLVYAITELADRVNCLQTGADALEFKTPVIEKPASRTRSIIRQFSSELEDKPWFYNKEYWGAYLNMLVSSRLNRLSFAFGQSYNNANNITDAYFNFLYPFLVNVPEHNVSVKGLSNEERTRNLNTLKFIGEEVTKRGLRFQLSIWCLSYKWNNSPNANYIIEGLSDQTQAAYCRDALAMILREVPTISGVTFRVHSEGGIPKGQDSFWKTQFDAIAKCGRRVEIDMHSKNMEPETLAVALETGQPVVISPKYCGEHLIPPYHPSAIRPNERVEASKIIDTGNGVLLGDRGYTRYGYADLLDNNRNWDVVYRVWPGTQRFLLNGDPTFFAGYGRIAAFGGAAGFEWFEPLGFKGRQGTGVEGGRCAYADATLNPTYDFEKYSYTYRLWGRLGYNPEADPEVWRRYLKQVFGMAALPVENALAHATRILPLFTLVHAPSADCLFYLPELYTNMYITDTTKRQPYYDAPNPKLFGNAGSFDPQFFLSPDETANTLVSGEANAKYSIIEAAQWLENLAEIATSNISEARKKLGTNASKPEFRRVEEDVIIQSALALFFANKLRSGVLWHIYATTGHLPAGEESIKLYSEGVEIWTKMAERAKGVYKPTISFGRNTLSGHWIDRIPAFKDDIADMRKRLESPDASVAKIDAAKGSMALASAMAKTVRPAVVAQHTPPATIRSGQSLAVSLRAKDLKKAKLHYRHVNQAEAWQSVELSGNGDIFQGEIPADYTAKRYALQYYFEVETAAKKNVLFPGFTSDISNTPYYVVHQA